MADNFTPMPVKGLKTANTTAPTNDNVGTLPAVASVAAPSNAEGNEVKLSTDLGGNLRVTIGAAGSALTVQGNKAHNTAAIGTDNIGALVAVASAAAPAALTDGRLAALSVDAANNLRVTMASTTMPVTGTKQTNVTATGGTDSVVALVGEVTTAAPTLTTGKVAGVSLQTDGSQRVAVTNVTQVSKTTAANASNNPISVRPSNGATDADFSAGATTSATQRVTLATGTGLGAAVTTPAYTLPVDAAGVATGTIANPLYVVAQEGSGSVKISSASSTATAANATATLNSTAITNAKVGKLAQLTMTASVRQKCILETFDGTTATAIATFFVNAFDTLVWRPVDTAEITQAGGAGKVFRVQARNQDNLAAADLYATFEWYEA